jgi:hypothetical protein
MGQPEASGVAVFGGFALFTPTARHAAINEYFD